MASKEEFETFIEELAERTVGTGDKAITITHPLISPLLDIFDSDPNFTSEMREQIYQIIDPEGE